MSRNILIKKLRKAAEKDLFVLLKYEDGTYATGLIKFFEPLSLEKFKLVHHQFEHHIKLEWLSDVYEISLKDINV